MKKVLCWPCKNWMVLIKTGILDAPKIYKCFICLAEIQIHENQNYA